MPASRTYQLSPSRIALWRRCRKAWWFRYVAELVGAPSRFLRVGKLAHEILARLGQRAIGAPGASPIGLSALVPGIVGQLIVDGLADANEATEAGEVVGQIAHRLNLGSVHAVEEWWELEHSGIVAAGRWDRVDLMDTGRVHIWDYKSGKTKMARWELESSPATLLYLAAAHEQWPDREASIVYWFLREDRPIRVDWTREKDAVARELMVNTMTEIEAETEYPVTVVPRHCDRCAWREACPAVP